MRAFLQSIQTARKTAAGFIAALAIPRPLPTNVLTFPWVQHFIDGFGTIEMPQIGYRLCPTLHLPNSVQPSFQAARFEYDDTYQDFAKKFDIKLALLRYHHDIPAQHAGGLLETQAAGWAVGRPQVDGTVSVFGYDSQSYSETDLFTAGFVQSRVCQAALAGPAGGAFNFDPVTAAGITPAQAVEATLGRNFQPQNLRVDEAPCGELSQIVLQT